jgi:hypothetical protein
VRVIALPPYIDREAWDALIEIRAAKKVPTTNYAAKLLLYEVQRIKDAGHDPNAAIKQSILKGYTDVYEPKEKPIQASASSEAERTSAYLAEQSKKVSVTVDVRGLLNEAKANIRRVV